MRFKFALAALTAVGAIIVIAAWNPANAMGPVGPSASNKAENSLVEKVHRRWRRGHYAYYPRYRYRPYYSYYRPYYYAPYYRSYGYPYYGAYYGPRYYGYGGFYRPRFGLRIGF
jgi:hypothetical protein